MVKKDNLLKINLKLFDEGEQGTDTGSDTSAVSSPQPEGGNTEPIVVYGKEDTATNTENDKNTSTQGNIDSNAKSQELLNFDLSKLTTPEARAEAFKQVKEAFKDEYSKDFQGHFDRRFKDYKELQQRLGNYNPIIETLLSYYGAKDVNELQKIIDDDILSDLAEKEGFPDVEKYKEYRASKEKAKAYDNKTMAEKQAADQKALVDSWIEQGMEFKKKPGNETFDLSAELNNPVFKDKLIRGLSVEEAYYLAHKDDMIKNAAAEAAKQAESNTVKNIQTKGARIPENGTAKTPGVIRKSDPSKFTEKDLEDIAKRVERGERIIL